MFATKKHSVLGEQISEIAKNEHRTYCPVIGGNSGGVPEAILHERTGLLVDPENAEHIYTGIRDLLSNKDWSQTLGENGRIRAENDFQWRKETEKLRRYFGGHTYG